MGGSECFQVTLKIVSGHPAAFRGERKNSVLLEMSNPQV